MHVRVNFNEMPDCPYCRRLRPVVESVCRRNGVPLIRRQVNVSPGIFGDDQLRHVFSEENARRLMPGVWREAEGDMEAREYLRVHGRSVHTPVVVVEAFPERGPALRFVIWGAPPEGMASEYGRNLESLLRALIRSEAV